VTEPEVDPRERRATMVIRVFGGIRVRPGMEDRERQFAEQLSSAVEAMPGFISRTTYPAADGEEVGVTRFDTRESLDNWVHEGEQLAAQAGASEFYESFWVVDAEAYREYAWKDGGHADHADVTSLFS
jgi:heme-degrading monooxygenase HmoA